jgi:L-ascorbate metabolism protein UlaG (beta-lactamase superfamily)
MIHITVKEIFHVSPLITPQADMFADDKWTMIHIETAQGHIWLYILHRNNMILPLQLYY